MLQLNEISKTYSAGQSKFDAVHKISLTLNKKGFVSIIGQSGCGKTTLLNIIGGLDQATSGDLLVDGVSTKKFRSADWDAYRNSAVGFIFQSYNLIQHLSILDNVALALTLSGEKEKKIKALEALTAVGLEKEINKYPNQLSGGQMQRVSIARAIVNNPLILLADEPTGALDNNNGEQVMTLLKKISSTCLVIVVTHNETLANKYSDRIIKLSDGKVTFDSNPQEANDASKQLMKLKKTSMNFFAALSLSFKNLLQKKIRTLITAFAASVGIIGIGLVQSANNGMMKYIHQMEVNTLAGLPITIVPEVTLERRNNNQYKEFPSGDVIYGYNPENNNVMHKNNLDEDYLDYLQQMPKDYYNSLDFRRSLAINTFVEKDNGVEKSYSRVSTMNEMPDREFVLSQYDLIGNSVFPTNPYEVAFVLDRYNRINYSMLSHYGLPLKENFTAADIIGHEVKILPNNLYYYESNGIYKSRTVNTALYNDEQAISLKVTAIIRRKKDSSWDLLRTGINFDSTLTDILLEDAINSDITTAQINAGETINVITGTPFDEILKAETIFRLLGADTTPAGILIYPKDFQAKSNIISYLDNWNKAKLADEQIIYEDPAEDIIKSLEQMIATISTVLIAFAGISLFVSTIMIGIITYVSVIERTKEIGILRSIGARKKDITRVFNAETILVGFTAGSLGILLTLALSFPLNRILASRIMVRGNTPINLFSLKPLDAIFLIAGSMILTLIGGFIPAWRASKKDPVVALRSSL